MFHIPKDGQTYVSDIVDRCEELIHRDIWSGLHIQRLRKWISNFLTDEERYFAACVLDSLIFRSKDQTLALIKQLFQRVIPDLARLDPTPIRPISDWQQCLRDENSDVRIVAAVKKRDPPTKSAHIVARLMKQYFFISEHNIIKPWEVEGCATIGIKVFLLIDDFLGTGDQIIELIKEEQLENSFSSIYIAYIPLVAHKDGINKLCAAFPALRVKGVEILDDSHSLFHDECSCFKDEMNTPESVKEFYYDLLKRKNIDIEGPDRRGYGHLEIAYVFEHAVPDNCLPILWWNSGGWFPLFSR